VRALVEYWVATYHGTVDVPCEADEDTESVCARAKAKLTRTSGGSLPYGAQRFVEKERTS
jgi:hypothetical protein